VGMRCAVAGIEQWVPLRILGMVIIEVIYALVQHVIGESHSRQDHWNINNNVHLQIFFVF